MKKLLPIAIALPASGGMWKSDLVPSRHPAGGGASNVGSG